MTWVNRTILLLTSMSAAIVSALVAFNAVSPDKGAAIGGVVSALAIGWHSAMEVGKNGVQQTSPQDSGQQNP